ncbi:MAG: gliding motility-associated C-terminal domain-containing protein, partial [Flavobacteriales bacterium]|nr:gliding motility-associated C-terminal domain-containing protein [Flavobacteriales bacterium]
LVPVLRDADPRFYEFRVFDRWGAEIFSSSAIGEGWDGTVNGEGPKTDVYNWMLRVKSAFNAETRSYRGMVALLK